MSPAHPALLCCAVWRASQVLREHSVKPGEHFLSSKRRAKIAELVEKYVVQLNK